LQNRGCAACVWTVYVAECAAYEQRVAARKDGGADLANERENKRA
jgi:hypothetical protein